MNTNDKHQESRLETIDKEISFYIKTLTRDGWSEQARKEMLDKVAKLRIERASIVGERFL